MLVRKASEMGLQRGLLRTPFGLVIRDFAFIRHSLAAALKELEKKPGSATWHKCLDAMSCGDGHVHLLLPPPSTARALEVSL